jgi:alpha-beta hydrolase superfamily lysophospholipase
LRACRYESLQTTIEENARILKHRLAEAGLGPQHGKSLHIVAHSTGGLVSRWFIEHDDHRRSIQSAPAGWITAPNRDHEVACDHISYFNTEAGLKALADALA